MGCFESYMEFREEVEKLRISQKDQVHLPEKQKGASPGVSAPPGNEGF